VSPGVSPTPSLVYLSVTVRIDVMSRLALFGHGAMRPIKMAAAHALSSSNTYGFTLRPRAIRAMLSIETFRSLSALDELFTLAQKYNSSDAYLELMRFVGRFRFYSPFNAVLIYTQMPGAHFVCTARRWRKDYRREIKIGARPIVILQPMGPILLNILE
jgi:hypothetical protein